MIKNIKLAETKSLVKYLKKIDKNQYYSNFGPLYYDVKKKILNYLSLKKKKIILT